MRVLLSFSSKYVPRTRWQSKRRSDKAVSVFQWNKLDLYGTIFRKERTHFALLTKRWSFVEKYYNFWSTIKVKIRLISSLYCRITAVRNFFPTLENFMLMYPLLIIKDMTNWGQTVRRNSDLSVGLRILRLVEVYYLVFLPSSPARSVFSFNPSRERNGIGRG